MRAGRKAAPAEVQRRRSRVLVTLAALAVAALLGGVAWWLWQSRAPAPVPSSPAEQLAARRLSFSLTVQKVRNGQPHQSPFQSTGRDFYENGWKFRLNFSSPQPGHLYLLNEGPAAGGRLSYHLLFPVPSANHGSAQLAAKQPMQTGWYVFDDNPGTERFWIIWAAQPVAALEAVKGVANPQDRGLISNPAERDAVRALLASSDPAQTEVKEDRAGKQTHVTGRGEVLISLIELEHH
jgi:hypothetical protein